MRRLIDTRLDYRRCRRPPIEVLDHGHGEAGLRASVWIPLENAVYGVVKLGLLVIVAQTSLRGGPRSPQRGSRRCCSRRR